MAQVVNINDTLTFYPVSIDSSLSDYYSVNSSYPITDALDAASTNDWAQFNINTGSRATTYVYYNFDCSEIPSAATITSISCSVKTYINTTNSSRITTRQVQLCTGTTTKGSATTISNSTNEVNLTCGSWTAAELQNAKIRLYVKRGTSNTTSNYYIRLYGATLTVSYSYQGTQYTIAATSTASGSTVSPATQEVLGGETAVVRLDIPVLGDVNVTDNNTDISSLLEIHEVPTGGTLSKTAESYTNSGINSGSSYAAYAVGHSAEDPQISTSNMYASNNSTGHVNYTFDFNDIPSDATITDVEVKCYGHRENSNVSSTYKAMVSLYSGSTQKGNDYELTSTSNYLFTVPTPGTWTRTELQNAILRFTVGYYGGLLCGITWNVTYTVPSSGNDYYYTYTLTNVSTDHAILVEEKGAYIPPEEDPEYTYWPITISSINATTNPGTGTTRVIEGTNQTITIAPEDPLLTLAMDNGVDITSQLVGGIPNNTYTVTTKVDGATYGFSLESSGYYVAQNSGVAKSASVARINLNLESNALVTIQYINYAEANYDYGMFGKLDTAVATDGLTASSGSSRPSDSTSNYQISMCSNSQQIQTVTYEVPNGEHFIDVKYGKDDASDSGNDYLQWKVVNIEATSAGGEYTYTLTNITEKHSLIFVFGEVDYYFITSSGNSSCRLFPDGQQVKLPGEGYRLNIVPNSISSGVTLTDNGIDVTTSLTREEGVDKYNNTVVSYSYILTDIQASHTLIVQVGEVLTTLYYKINNTWRPITKAYRKVNGSWVEISDLTTVFSKTKNYRKG